MIDYPYSNRITPDKITRLRANEVFVFGSNLAGKHGAGAAKQALHWGAVYGIGVGQRGRTYAIPTKDYSIQTLKVEIIAEYVDGFIERAKYATDQDQIFLVTEIGCGLAGMTPEQIAPLFRGAIDLPNVHLPKRFWEVLLKD